MNKQESWATAVKVSRTYPLNNMIGKESRKQAVGFHFQNIKPAPSAEFVDYCVYNRVHDDINNQQEVKGLEDSPHDDKECSSDTINVHSVETLKKIHVFLNTAAIAGGLACAGGRHWCLLAKQLPGMIPDPFARKQVSTFSHSQTVRHDIGEQRPRLSRRAYALTCRRSHVVQSWHL